MPDPTNLAITIRRCYLMSSTIIGYARVVIDREILLKELPIFCSDDELMVQVSTIQVAMCPEDMDGDMLNRMVWVFRTQLEEAIIAACKKKG